MTLPLERKPDPRPAASGLLHCESGQVYMFAELGPLIRIGTSAICGIRLESPFVSAVHAVLRRRDGTMWLRDMSKYNTTFVEGWAITGQPTALLIGMEIQFGRTVMMATNESGTFPFAARTLSELAAKARERLGSYRKAAEYLNRSHTTVRRYTRRYWARHSRKKQGDENGTI